VAAQPKTEPDPFLSDQGVDVHALKDVARSWVTLDEGWEERLLAEDLHRRLLAGAQNELSRTSLDEPALSLKRVAEFLAWIANVSQAAFARDRGAYLGGLGIK
jgi:hypothetical protein